MSKKRVDSSVHVLYTNIRSLRNKVHNLEFELQLFPNTVAICLTETHLGPEISSGEIAIKNYHLFRNDRDGSGGGVAVYARSDFHTEKVPLKSNTESILVSFSSANVSFFLLVVYRPPNEQQSMSIPTLLDEVCKIVGLNKLLICGDFNMPQIDWTNFIATGNKKIGEPFLSKLADLSFEQYVFEPTHDMGNILDLVISNKNVVQGIEICAPLYSDHSLIVVKLNIVNEEVLESKKIIYCYNKACTSQAKEVFSCYEKAIDDHIRNQMPINDIYHLFCVGVLSLRDKCVPIKTVKITQQPPWFTNRIRNTIKKQKRFYNLMKKFKTNYYISRFNTIKKHNRKLINQSKKSYLSKTLYKPLLSGDSKAFYRHIKNSRENGTDVIPDLTNNNITAKSPLEKANMLNSFFKANFTVDDGGIPPSDYPSCEIDDSNLVITVDGVLKLLNDIQVSKSCGPDNITGILLKTFSSCICTSLTKIFNYSVETSSIPDVWKLGKVKPVFKKGSRQQPNNYRPISLTCITCKLLEHIITSNILNFLSNKDILSDAQHGFRKERSCVTQLVYTVNELAVNKENGLVTDVLILDFAKAFDSVNHRKLLFKLEKVGIHPTYIAWIRQFLSHRKQLVIVDGVASQTCSVLSGVPQGSVLGPLLFILYINDLPQNIMSQCRLFADDALLFNTRDKCDTLAKDLKTLEAWSRTWQLSFNTAKCAVLSIGEKDSKQVYFLNGSRLKNVNSHPYLGVELNYNLKFSRHIDNITSKASRVQGMLSRVLKSADTKTRLVAYKTLVRSNLEYACQVWDPHLKKDIKKLEKVQNKSLRFIYRIKSPISISKLKDDTNISTLKKRRKDQRMKLFIEAHRTGVIEKTVESPHHPHNTRQTGSLYLPTIKSSAYFHSFWPRTTRDIRGDHSSE